LLISLSSFEKSRTQIISLNLEGGELIEFDTKLLHRAIDPHPNRVGIGMWIDKIPMSDRNNWE
jgi:hypothetical protein